jgi:hypothetical protein
MRARYVIDTASLRAVAEHEMADASTARQEAETLRKQRDEAEALLQRYMGSSVKKLIEEAETLRSQLDARPAFTERDVRLMNDLVRFAMENDAYPDEIADARDLWKRVAAAARVAAPREPT